MFGLNALELARIQFGFTISAHIIFPATTIGLASYPYSPLRLLSAECPPASTICIDGG